MSDSTITAVSGRVAPSAPDAKDLPWWARRAGFGWITVITGLASLIAAGVLVAERVQLYLNADAVASCDWGGAFSCTSVMLSEQAQAFGFPNPFMGLVGFGILVVIGVSVLSGASMPRWYWVCFQLGVAAAFGFLIWLYSVALFEIRALCIYCMVCWLMITVLFFISLARNILTGVFAAPRWLQGWASGWAWITAFVLLLACAGSIIINFMGLLFPAS